MESSKVVDIIDPEPPVGFCIHGYAGNVVETECAKCMIDLKLIKTLDEGLKKSVDQIKRAQFRVQTRFQQPPPDGSDFSKY